MAIPLCHAIDCSERIPLNRLMCPRHWYMVPPAIRRFVWKTYTPGQEGDRVIRPEYFDAARAAINAVAEQEGKPKLLEEEELIKTLETILAKSKISPPLL